MYDDIRLHVARSYTSSADSPLSLMSSFTLSNHLLFLLPCTFITIALLPTQCSSLRITCPCRTTSTFFPVFLCFLPHFRCPSYSFISDIVQLRNSANLVIHLMFVYSIWNIQNNIRTLLYLPRPRDRRIKGIYVSVLS